MALTLLRLSRRGNLKQSTDDIWEEPNHILDKALFYGRNNQESPSFHIFYREGGYNSTVYGKGGRGNRKGGMYLRCEKLAAIIKSLISGNGIRKTARICGVSKNTVTKAKTKILPKIKRHLIDFQIFCKCGKEIGHKGSCISKNDTEHNLRRQWYQENIITERARKRKNDGLNNNP